MQRQTGKHAAKSCAETVQVFKDKKCQSHTREVFTPPPHIKDHLLLLVNQPTMELRSVKIDAIQLHLMVFFFFFFAEHK